MRPAYRWRIIFGALLVCAVSGAVFLFSPKPVVADPENAHISFFHVRDGETGEPLWIALDEQTEREILQSLQTCEAVLTLYNPDRQMREVMLVVSERDRITTIQLGENEGYCYGSRMPERGIAGLPDALRNSFQRRIQDPERVQEDILAILDKTEMQIIE